MPEAAEPWCGAAVDAFVCATLASSARRSPPLNCASLMIITTKITKCLLSNAAMVASKKARHFPDWYYRLSSQYDFDLIYDELIYSPDFDQDLSELEEKEEKKKMNNSTTVMDRTANAMIESRSNHTTGLKPSSTTN